MTLKEKQEWLITLSRQNKDKQFKTMLNAIQTKDELKPTISHASQFKYLISANFVNDIFKSSFTQKSIQ